MSANWKRKLNLTKKTLTISPHIFQIFIASHTISLQLFLRTSLLLWPSSNPNSIRHFIIITYLFFKITLFIKSTCLFLIICSILITYTDAPFVLPLIAWHKWWILATHIFLKSNSTTQAHLKPLHFLSTSNCWFSLPDISRWIIKI